MADASAALHDALADIIEGRGVKRADHALRGPGGEICVPLFLAILNEAGYASHPLSEIQVGETERLPAWFVDEEHTLARFGWVFWERFGPGRARKLFGTVHKNNKGDWDLMLGERSPKPIHVNLAIRVACDPDNPSQW